MQLLTDSNTAMYYVNKQRGSHSSSCKEAVKLWGWCIQHSVYPIDLHLADMDNSLAGQLSRDVMELHKHTLKKWVIGDTFNLWGLLYIDLVAI